MALFDNTYVDDSGIRLTLNLDLGVIMGDPGIVVRGAAMVRDGTSNTVLISERSGSTARCSVDSDTGDEGITNLSLLFREPRSGERVIVVIEPANGPATIPGSHDVRITIDDDEFEGTLQVRSIGHPAAERVERRDR
jgi:hypothetical protein